MSRQLRPNERLFAFFDDIYLTTKPDRVGAGNAILEQELRVHACIPVHIGKTKIWNQEFFPRAAFPYPPAFKLDLLLTVRSWCRPLDISGRRLRTGWGLGEKGFRVGEWWRASVEKQVGV